MPRERSRELCPDGPSDFGRAKLHLTDQLAPLPDWSHLGRHILAEAMRRAMARMDSRAARSAHDVDSHAKERS